MKAMMIISCSNGFEVSILGTFYFFFYRNTITTSDTVRLTSKLSPNYGYGRKNDRKCRWYQNDQEGLKRG